MSWAVLKRQDRQIEWRQDVSSEESPHLFESSLNWKEGKLHKVHSADIW